jgi:hypothetical protein
MHTNVSFENFMKSKEVRKSQSGDMKYVRDFDRETKIQRVCEVQV